MSAGAPHVLDQLSAYVDAMVTPTEKQVIGDHLTQCAECAQRHQELLHIRKIFRETPLLSPPNEVYVAVRRRSGMAQRVIWQRIRKPLQIFVGVCVVAVAGKFLFSMLQKVDFSRSVSEPPKPVPVVATTTVLVSTPIASTSVTSTTVPETTTTILAEVKKVTKPAAPKKTASTAKKPAPKTRRINRQNLAGAVLPADSAVPVTPSQRPSLEAHLPSQTSKIKPSDLVEWRGVDSKIQKSKTYIIRSTDEMEGLWRKHAPDAPVPVVDFDLYIVVGVTTGQNHVKGKGIEVMGTRSTSEAFIVYLREGTDFFRQPTTLSTFTPYHFKVIPKPELPVQFQRM